MNIAIVGYGSQGRSAYEYWRDGNDITVCDANQQLELPSDVAQKLGPDHLSDLGAFDLIIRSPIIHPRDLVAANSPTILDKVTTVSNEFLRVCPTKNVIGVTGTKGKGTTSTLITKMLEADGKTVHLGGNIGIPPLDLLHNDIQPDDWVVLELANFQLIDLTYSPHLAACLLVVPEHLDWHGTMEDYVQAKQQLFRWQTGDDIAVYYAASEFSKQVVSVSGGTKLPYFAPPGALVENDLVTIDGQAICKTDEIKLIGTHNWQNVCAAVTVVWQITQNTEAIKSVLTSFAGLPFRIEFRREANGIRYYNDSFASAPHAPLAAIAAIPDKQVVILGGFDRGLALDDLAKNLLEHTDSIERLLLIGASGPRLAECLDKYGFTNYQVSDAKDMPSVVVQASALAQPGQAVVLSPGFASFDMFKNFEDRGIQFNEVVDTL
jgi:UDP-N-acetylmuramoylalanine--D-glutamate ligase